MSEPAAIWGAPTGTSVERLRAPWVGDGMRVVRTTTVVVVAMMLVAHNLAAEPRNLEELDRSALVTARPRVGGR